jgi:hypothetical protein
MTPGEQVLTQAPTDLVMPAKNPAKRGDRQRRLIEWCEAHGALPSLLELEAERDRRDRDRVVNRLMRPHWEARDRGAGS